MKFVYVDESGSKDKAKVAALFTGFIRDPDGTVAGLNGGGAVNGVLQVGPAPHGPISNLQVRSE